MYQDNEKQLYWSALSCCYSVVPDSDEAFLSLKKSSKHKENGCSKKKKDSDTKETKSKQVKTPPVKSPSTEGDAKKNVLSPTPPKSTAPKHTPTSVFDYFGNSTAKRSDKKLVASTSTKRKEVSTPAELQCSSFRPCSELVLTVVWSETEFMMSTWSQESFTGGLQSSYRPKISSVWDEQWSRINQCMNKTGCSSASPVF